MCFAVGSQHDRNIATLVFLARCDQCISSRRPSKHLHRRRALPVLALAYSDSGCSLAAADRRVHNCLPCHGAMAILRHKRVYIVGGIFWMNCVSCAIKLLSGCGGDEQSCAPAGLRVCTDGV
jgi:hypothetical protein